MSLIIKLADKVVPFDLWDGKSAFGGNLVSFHTQTSPVTVGEVPAFVIAAATDGERGVFIAKQQLASFFAAHPQIILAHDAAFHLDVVDKAGFRTDALVDSHRVFCTAMIYRLLRLADIGQVPGQWSLNAAAQDLGLPHDEKTMSHDGKKIATTFGRFLGHDGEPNYQVMVRPEFRVYLEHAATNVVTVSVLAGMLNEWAQLLFDQPLLNIFDRTSYCHAPVCDGINMADAWERFGFLTHDVQLQGAIGLAATGREGLCIDTTNVSDANRELDIQLKDLKAKLAGFGWRPGAGSEKALNARLAVEEKALGEKLPRLESDVNYSVGESAFCHAAEDLQEFRDRSEFIDAYLTFEEVNKLKSTYLSPMQAAVAKVFGDFNELLTTGRTSCRAKKDDRGKKLGLNLQNFPREGKARECIIPSPDTFLFAADFVMVELLTFSKNCLARYGFSKMADAINRGADVHCVFAAMRKKIDISRLPDWSKKTLMPLLGATKAEAKGERQKAKVGNFGNPGGLGPASTVRYAKHSYGVTITEVEAKAQKEQWLDTWDEARLHLESEEMAHLSREFWSLWPSYPDRNCRFAVNEVPWVIHILRGVVSGQKLTSTKNRPYTPTEVEWAWRVAEHIATTATYVEDSKRTVLLTKVRERLAGKDLWNSLTPRQRWTATYTGRLRGNPSFCAAKNNQFQGPAADGLKLALYQLRRAGHRVVNEIHDEVLIELPIGCDYKAEAEKIRAIMIAAMSEIVAPIKVEVEFALMRRWFKGAEARYDESGQLVPVRPVRDEKGDVVDWAHDTGNEPRR